MAWAGRMRRRAPKVGFGDMPTALRDLPLDAPAALREARNAWLAEHGLPLCDYLAWLSAGRLVSRLRPPSRRRSMSPKELAEFDARREQEGEPRW
jgi:hypothetical protein